MVSNTAGIWHDSIPAIISDATTWLIHLYIRDASDFKETHSNYPVFAHIQFSKVCFKV